MNRDMQGTPPGSQRRELTLGNQVIQNERIETSSVGSGQLLFIDQTSLTVAPESDIVLDEYVYDPAQDEGTMTLSLTRGALRFVGGRLSKKREVGIRTPTATIGIRGGMVLVQVAEDGSVIVTLIAGEYVTVTGQGGGKVTLSRPNATAAVDSAGDASFIGIATRDDLAPIFKSLEGNGDGGAGPTVTNAAPTTDQVAAVNSGQTGGETAQPVSTSGEQGASEPQQDEDAPALTRTQEVGPPQLVAPPPQQPLPAAGALITSSAISDPENGGVGFLLSSDLAFDPLTNISAGSIIGESAGGSTLRIETPTDPAELAARTDIIFSALSIPELLPPANENAGYWESFTTSTGSTLPGALPPGALGTLDGVPLQVAFGYSDLTEDFQFHLGTASTGTGTTATRINFLFGDPTPGNGAQHLLDDGSFATTANTVDVYETDHVGFGTANNRGLVRNEAQNLILVGNAGETRTDGTGRWLSGGVRFSGGFGSITVFAGGVLDQGGGPVLSTTSETVTQFGTNDPSDLQVYQTVSDPRGTLPDGEGNSLWGETGEYLVVTTVDNGTGTPSHVEGSVVQVNLNAAAAGLDPRIEGVTAPEINRYQRAPGRSEIIENATPLLNDNGTGTQLTTLNSHFGGFTRCETGFCGSNFEDGDPTGAYLTRGTGELAFEPQIVGADGNRMAVRDWSFDTFTANFATGFGFTDRVIFGNGGAVFNNAGTYATDRVFGQAASDQGHFIFNAETGSAFGITPSESSFILGSAALLGTEGLTFDPSVNLDPEFSRWGFWAASYEVTEDTGITRLDVTIPQPFVAGASFPDLLPATGTAGYSGFAVAQQLNNDTGQIVYATGTFDIVYDFGLSEGAFTLSLPDIGVAANGVPIAGGATSDQQHQFSGLQNVDDIGGANFFETNVSGQFTGTESTPDGGVIGSFTHIADDFELHTSGVFAGDKSALPPVGFLPLLEPNQGALVRMTLSDGSLAAANPASSRTLLGATLEYDPIFEIQRGSTLQSNLLTTQSGLGLELLIPQSPTDTTLSDNGSTTNGGFTVISGTQGTWFNTLDNFPSTEGSQDGVFASGFSDLNPESQFHAIGFLTLVFDPENGTITDFVTDFAVLAEGTMGQGHVHPADDGSFGSDANTLEVLSLTSNPLNQSLLAFSAEPPRTAEGNLINGGVSPFLFNNQEILLIGNAGEARVPETATAAPDGARWLAANVQLSDPFVVTGTSNTQFTAGLGVLAGPVRTDGAGNLVLSLEGTSLSVVEVGGTGSSPTQIIRRENIGNFPTPEGSTIFGAEGQYQVIGSINRGTEFADGSGQGLLALEPITGDPGTVTFLANDTEETVPNHLTEFVAIRDDPSSVIVADPFPLAQPTQGFGGEPGLAQLSSTGFAVGHVFCSDGQCDNNGLGVYETSSDDLKIDFGNRAGTLAEDAFGVPDSNTVQAEMTLSFPNNDNFAGTTEEGAPFFNYDTITVGSFAQATSDEFGAAASDRVFAINQSDAEVTFTVEETFEGSLPLTLTHTEGGNVFLLASSEVAGVPDGFFPASVDQTPEFMRWGYWAADVNVQGDDDGQARHDTVPLGFWVAGPDQVAADMPFSGAATYSGLVAATLQEIGTHNVGHHGGSFSLDYDFGLSEGTFGYSLPGAGIGASGIEVIGGGTGSVDYNGGIGAANAGGVTELHLVQGRFYGTPGNPAAGTGGIIDILDNTRGLEGQAVFGGDQTSFTPDPGS